MIGPIAYIGGKRRLARTLITLFPEHTTYVEPFAGGAQVFFAKPVSKVEVINDLDGEVVNFFRVCQSHQGELIRYLKYMVASRRLFELFSKQDPTTLTDVQRAARYLYLQKTAFGGKIHHRHFHYGVTKPLNYNPVSLPGVIEAASKRLSRTQIECRPYEQVLASFDRPTTFFYLDPPYVGVDFYRHNFTNDDFAKLASKLALLRGKFLLSINDDPVARKVFGGFHIREIQLTYTLARSVPTVTELLFSNYELPSFASRLTNAP